MQEKQNTLSIFFHQALDIFILISAFIAAFLLDNMIFPDSLENCSLFSNEFYIALMHPLLILSITFNVMNIYVPFYKKSTFMLILQTIKVISIGFLIFLTTKHFFFTDLHSRSIVINYYFICLIFLCLSKGLLSFANSFNNKREISSKNLLIIGSRERAVELIKTINRNTTSKFKILGCLETSSECHKTGNIVFGDVKVIGDLSSFNDLLLNSPVDEVIFAIPLKKIESARDYISFAEELGVKIRILPDWQIQKIMYRPETANIYFEDFLGLPTIAASSTPQREAELLIKSAMDILGSGLGLVIISPLFILVSLLIKCTSRGPVFFTQKRSGINNTFAKNITN
jgi:FlaA1/EpsC-like NDP-sugar epimerase